MGKVKDNLPKIEKMMDSVGKIFIAIGDTLSNHMDQFMMLGELLANALSFVADFPTLSGIAVMSLMALKSGFLSAADSVGSFKKQLETSNAELLKMNKNSAMLIGGSGLAAGATAFSDSQGEAENATSGLKAMGMAAAFGASQFGLMGAAIGATAVALGGLISGVYQLYKANKGADETIEQIEARSKDMDKLLELRKAWKNGDAAGAVNYQRALSDFEAKWGSLEGSYLVEGFGGRGVYGKALDQAMKQQIDVKVNSDNTITQNVTMETSLAEASVVMRTNLREFIQEQLQVDSKSVGAAFAI